MNKTSLLSLSGIVLFLAVGCMTPGIQRTARTLPQGEGDFSMSFNYTRLSFDETETVDSVGGENDVITPAESFAFPNFIPDILYNYGVSENFELGGKLGLGSALLEFNGKYRFLRSSEVHLAVAPAVGFRALGIVSGPVFTLPVLATYDLNDKISLNGGVLATYSSYSSHIDEVDEADLSGDTFYAGLGAGLELRTNGSFHIMPAVEYQRSLSRSGDVLDLPAVDLLFVSVTLGWGPNARLRKMDKQLDRIEEKLDKK